MHCSSCGFKRDLAPSCHLLCRRKFFRVDLLVEDMEEMTMAFLYDTRTDLKVGDVMENWKETAKVLESRVSMGNPRI